MCLIAFALNAAPGRPLLIAANRDEHLDRPTAPLHRWALPGGVEVVGGRDLREGGTWLGLSAQGRVAMLTNVRQATAHPGARSRGELVTRWLQDPAGDAERFAAGLDAAAYAGFNLVVGDFHARRWSWLSNRRPDDPHAPDVPATALHQRALGDGVYGLSNASLDTPWPKTLRLKQAMHDALARPGAADLQDGWAAPLLQALFDDQPAPAADRPRTGVPADAERALSSPFVHMPQRGYGTRSSLLVSARADDAPGWRVEVMEWTHELAQAERPSPDKARLHQENLRW